ncbi:extracellular solute-binding protein [Chloroflexia bacterium SDU3-3]|nr:extracellular solute-binding protein [Chloroflexia bacterium SDU3-3]
MKKSTLLSATLLVVFAAFLLYGYAHPPALPEPLQSVTTAPNATAITFATSNISTMQPLADAFMRQNPDISIHLTDLSISAPASSEDAAQYTQTLRAAIYKSDVIQADEVPRSLLREGVLLDLNPLMQADATFDPNDIFPRAIQTVEGRVYTMPSTLWVWFLAYDRDAIRNAGIAEPLALDSWDDLARVAGQLARRNGAAITRYGMLDLGGNHTLAGALAQNPLDSAAAIEPDVERWQRLIATGAILPFDTTSQTWMSDYQQMMAARKAAMWDAMMLPVDPSERPDIPIGLAAMPWVADGDMVRGGLGISAGTQHPQAAWRWVSFLTRQDLRFDQTDLQFAPVRRSVADQQGYWGMGDAIWQQAMRAALEQRQPANDERVMLRNTFALQVARAILAQHQPVGQAVADALEAYQRDRLAMEQRPAATARPFQVDAPPVAAAGATPITFAVPPMRMAALARLADVFNREHPESFITLVNADQGAASDCALGEPGLPFTRTLDLQPLLDVDAATQADIPPALLALSRQSGELPTLPLALWLRALRYQADLAQARSVEIPSGVWGMGDFARAVDALGGQEGASYAFVVRPGDASYWVRQFGGAGAALRLNSPEALAAMQALRDLARASARDLPPMGTPEYASAARSASSALWFDAPTGDSIYSSLGGTLSWLALAPPPGDPARLSADDIEISVVLAISAQSDHGEACWPWLRYLGAQPVAIPPERFPARRSLATGADWAATAAAGSAQVYAAYAPLLAQQHPAATPQVARSAVDRLLLGALDASLHGDNLAQALDDAQKRYEQVLACLARSPDDWACSPE